MNEILLYRQGYRFLLTGIVIFSLLLTSACISESTVKKITAFSDGTDAVMSNTIEVFELVEEKHLVRKKAALVNQYTKDKTVARNFKIEPFFPKEIWEGRMLVIKGLQTYAANLKAVVGNEKLTEFDASTKALGLKLQEVDEQFVSTNVLNNKPVPIGVLQLFTSAVNTIGRWFVDYKREKVTKQTLKEMNKAVNEVCNLLAQDLGEKPYLADEIRLNPAVLGLRSKLWQDHTLIINERIVFLGNCDDIKPYDPMEPPDRTKLREQCKNYFTSATERRSEIEYIANLIVERKKTDDMVAAVKEALEAIPSAHGMLEKAFDEKDTTLEGLISKVINEAKRIKAFHESLTKTE